MSCSVSTTSSACRTASAAVIVDDSDSDSDNDSDSDSDNNGDSDANGTASGGRFDPSAWHTLTLATRDAGGSHPTKAYVVVDGAVFGQRGPFMKGAGHHSHAGMVALCSGWHLADFDDFTPFYKGL